ncbi:membrane protein insertion efficiency factor YidD [Cellulomonas bogoriensis]|uniref:Putative membrane protein insertion efficiency factor n=1 Tax=Cellulomonas bogoriensis 69B4 = DSM 16987 TaxID=1386082 RepID=A0A0A0C1Q0_9CELL|nr:membrane protein insertion efficiency factor YidD [Cellulomonas bogoriensis]KGM13284.1 membrane protein insertion efficiency factor [Cellulomonas bogoriensis 69B4 = DSM 16987]
MTAPAAAVTTRPAQRHRRGWRTVPRLLLLLPLRFYQVFVSPLTGPTCRYYPSCSQYAVIAVQRHGAARGAWLAVRRLGRCHPWTAGGVDDVPPARGSDLHDLPDGYDAPSTRSPER